MGRFTTFNINKPLLDSFREVFSNRIGNPKANIPLGIKTTMETKEVLTFAEWRAYIGTQIRTKVEEKIIENN